MVAILPAKEIIANAMEGDSPDKVKFKASDLRGILEYVPLYRNQIFVIAIDGAIIACENFTNIVTDIAVLRSLGINVAVVCGISAQLEELGNSRGVALSDLRGEGPVDDATLALAREASATVVQRVCDAFAAKDIRCASSNIIRATEVGIISGVNQLNAGRIERIDFSTLGNLLTLGIVPVVPPLAPDRNGKFYRINSDSLASDMAVGLRASKLVYLTLTRSVRAGGASRAEAANVAEIKELLETKPSEFDSRVLSKVRCAVRALETACTQRAHILDGRDFACLLNEFFDKVGCGTMIYADEYQKIRKATIQDATAIYNMSKVSAKEQNLVYRSLEEIAANIDAYYVYEMDGGIIAFVSLINHGNGDAELASLHVQPFYQGHGVGRRMAEFVKKRAREEGYKRLFTLTTKSAPFFSNSCGFVETSPDMLPKARLEKYEKSHRNSKVFIIEL